MNQKRVSVIILRCIFCNELVDPVYKTGLNPTDSVIKFNSMT